MIKALPQSLYTKGKKKRDRSYELDDRNNYTTLDELMVEIKTLQINEELYQGGNIDEMRGHISCLSRPYQPIHKYSTRRGNK